MTQSLSPHQKAAILLSVLGKETTQILFSHLNDIDVQNILEEMKQVHKASHHLIKELLEEYFDATSEKTQYLFPNFVADMAPEFSINYKARNLKLEALSRVDNKSLSLFLRTEHPQTITLILSQLSKERKKDLFVLLPQNIQIEVLIRMVKIEQVDPQTINEINDLLTKEFSKKNLPMKNKLGGAKVAADMIKGLSPKDQERILSTLDNEDIRNELFLFEDFQKIEDVDLQKFIPKVENKLWVLSLRLASEELRQKIFKNMSQRASKLLMEEIQDLPLTKRSLIEEAKQSIIKKFKEFI